MTIVSFSIDLVRVKMVRLQEYFWDIEISPNGEYLLDRIIMKEMNEERCYSVYEAYLYLIQIWKEFNLYRYVGQYTMIGKLWKEGRKKVSLLDVIYWYPKLEECAIELECSFSDLLKIQETRGRLIRAELEKLNKVACEEGRNLYTDIPT